ncbi:hypothetical protein RHSIM_Rhsim04G0136500 [Rhododendron simsii]|uniref:DUF4283 domain-containing protein n=1 Tax=Rhododendron simsii TaxID=118357 RepID=A0A834LRN6_RHOSS|nr:hypothetical protein RHSIM_Rhsim04G0136500 [Rhododendron simsii]
MDLDVQFPLLLSSSLVKNPKHVENPKNVENSFSRAAESAAHSVTLMDYVGAISPPVVPVQAGGSQFGIGNENVSAVKNVSLRHEDGNPTMHQSNPLPLWRDKVTVDNGQERMRLEFIPPHIEDDVIVVAPPIAVEEQGIDKWRNCLVGHFLDKKMSYRAVNSIVMRIWERFGIRAVIANEHGFFFFLFKRDGALSKVLEAGPWLIGGKLLVLKKWQPYMAFVKDHLEKIPIWVHFYNVPFEYWTANGFSHIASSVGVPLYADEQTEKCKRLSFARICVEVDLDSSFPDSFELRFPNGDSVVVGIKYPWHPLKCMGCRVFGHSDDYCPLRGVASTSSKGLVGAASSEKPGAVGSTMAAGPVVQPMGADMSVGFSIATAPVVDSIVVQHNGQDGGSDPRISAAIGFGLSKEVSLSGLKGSLGVLVDTSQGILIQICDDAAIDLVVEHFAPVVNPIHKCRVLSPLPSGDEMGDIGFISSPMTRSCLKGNQFSPLLDMELKLDKVSAINDGDDDSQDIIATTAPLEVSSVPSGNEVLASSLMTRSFLHGNQFSPFLDMELKLDKVSATHDGDDDSQGIIESVAPLEGCSVPSGNDVLAPVPKVGRVTRGKGCGKKSKLLQ